MGSSITPGITSGLFSTPCGKGARSPYAQWYSCQDFPLRQYPKANYECWWGFPSLPKLNVANPDVLSYLTRVITFWTSLGHRRLAAGCAQRSARLLLALFPPTRAGDQPRSLPGGGDLG